jgi:cell division topological specificity factor
MGLIDGLIDYLRGDQRKTAVDAKSRLKLILAHDRGQRGAATPDYLPALKAELIEVIKKYVHLDPSQITVQLGKHGEYDVLELNVTLPEPGGR